MSASEKPLHIDIPVKLKDVKTVYSIGANALTLTRHYLAGLRL